MGQLQDFVMAGQAVDTKRMTAHPVATTPTPKLQAIVPETVQQNIEQPILRAPPAVVTQSVIEEFAIEKPVAQPPPQTETRSVSVAPLSIGQERVYIDVK